MTSASRAVFLDRDGVLTIPEFRDGRSFAPRRLADFRIYEEASACLGRLRSAGLRLVVVTNQPDVGNGLVTKPVADEMNSRLAAALPLDAIEACYHGQAENCYCRKPKPGMLRRASRRLGIDCRSSFMIGDRGSDVAAGRAVGCTTILIDRGYRDEPPSLPDFTASCLTEATDIVLERLSIRRGE